MKKGLIIGIVAVIACCAVAFGVHHQIQRTAQMRAAVDSAFVQNRNYVPFTSDSTLREVAAYFDHPLHFWITANDRLRAHYALGCVYRDLHDAPIALLTWEDAIAAADTTAADCDFATLFRVYGQMADVYFRQYMPEKQLDASEQYCNFALQAGDTLSYIRGLLLRNDAFLALRDTAAIYRNIANVRRLYLQRGLKAEAAQVYPMAIRLAVEKQQLDSARAMIQVFEQESGLFDEQGNIAPTREIYYFRKGLYYLGVNRMDSAEIQFRRLQRFKANLVDAYRGLLILFQQRHEPDSIFKYARLYEDALGLYLDDTKTQAIAHSEGLYDYSRQQQTAHRMERWRNVFIIALLIAIVLILVLYAYYKKQQFIKEVQHLEYEKLVERYTANMEKLAEMQNDVAVLQQEAFKNEETKDLLHSKEKQIIELENLVDELSGLLRYTPSNSQQDCHKETEIIDKFHYICKRHIETNGERIKTIPQRKATEKEWLQLRRYTRLYYPKFYHFLQEHKMSELEFKVCLLSRYGFKNAEMAVLTSSRNQSISNARKILAENLFGLNSAYELNKHLLEI